MSNEPKTIRKSKQVEGYGHKVEILQFKSRKFYRALDLKAGRGGGYITHGDYVKHTALLALDRSDETPVAGPVLSEADLDQYDPLFLQLVVDAVKEINDFDGYLKMIEEKKAPGGESPPA